ncbi:MAG: hypothetical protein AAB796_01475 [Patescibacteria group bacterium]
MDHQALKILEDSIGIQQAQDLNVLKIMQCRFNILECEQELGMFSNPYFPQIESLDRMKAAAETRLRELKNERAQLADEFKENQRKLEKLRAELSDRRTLP